MNLKAAPFGIEQEYTFYQDFQIADRIGGKKGVLDTWKQVQQWQDNPRAWGEVTCALNWRLWDLLDLNEDIAKLYQQLYQESQDIGWDRGEKDKEYAKTYFKVTD